MGEVILLGSIFCSAITVYLLFNKADSYQLFSSRILAVFFIANTWCAIAYLLIISNWIIYIPHFYKTAAPFNFLIPLLGYLYIRTLLKNEVAFQKYDWLHFIPFVACLINYLPLYTMGATEKSKLVALLIEDYSINYTSKDGFLAENIIRGARIIQIPIYLFFQWQLVLTFNKKKIAPIYEAHKKHVLKWLTIFNWNSSLILISVLFLFALFYFNPQIVTSKMIITIPALAIAIGYLILSSFLLLNPAVLFGFPNNISNNEKENASKLKVSHRLITKNYEKTTEELLSYFKVNQPFLKTTISINEVAHALNISVSELSFIINHKFNQRFTEFVNKYRIEFVINKIEDGFCDKFTVESLSKMAGFASKSTFNIAFKKIMLCTPSEFIGQKNNELQKLSKFV
jgi:AraC-like DNA-binding protein